MNISERIKKRREELGISQEHLAELLGYKSRSSINKIELGLSEIPLAKLPSFAKALKTTPEYIMGLDEEDTKKEEDTSAMFRVDLSNFPEEKQKKIKNDLERFLKFLLEEKE